MDSPDVLHRRRLRDRLVTRVSVMGQVSALLAMASTGVTAGVLAHDAQVKDLQAAQAKAAVGAKPRPAAPVVRLVPRPVRTVVVRVPAASKSLSRKANRTTAVRRTVVASAPRRVVTRSAPKAAPPKPATQPAATTSTGS